MPWATGFFTCLPQHVPSPKRNPRAPQCGKVHRSCVEVEQRTSIQAFTQRGHVGVYLQVLYEIVLRDEVRVAEDPEREGYVGNVEIPFGIDCWEGPVGRNIGRVVPRGTDWGWELSGRWSDCGDIAAFCDDHRRITGL